MKKIPLRQRKMCLTHECSNLTNENGIFCSRCWKLMASTERRRIAHKLRCLAARPQGSDSGYCSSR